MIRAFQWDLARQVERPDFLRALLPRYAAWGYQELYLHLEDAVHYPSLPGIGREDAYRYEELGELVLAAAQAGIRVVPIVNLLGHTQYLIKHPDWRDLNELRDERGRPRETGQVCPLHHRLPELAERLLRDMAPFCTAGKVHVGLDESFSMGKCPRCREEVSRIGLGAHFAGHVRRLHALSARLELRMGMWADMLYFVPEAIPLLPAGITAYDWYYYPFARHPRVEMFNFAERDLATPLKKQGIRYFGCPMNGAFRYEPLPIFGDRLGNIQSWWRRCQAVGAEGMLITSWEAYRLALETTTIVDAAAASLWLEPEIDDHTALLARGLERALRVRQPRALARTLLSADEHAFAGYARWQINDRWDLFAGEEPLRPYERERSFFRKLRAGKHPPALGASFGFRAYLAERDVFVRTSARNALRWRRLWGTGKTGELLREIRAARVQADVFAGQLQAARKHARAMARRSRPISARNQNEEILDADERRLSAWCQWLRKALQEPSLVREASPLAGAWQLRFWVTNFAPAGQKILVEERQPDDTWLTLASRHSIEFRAMAARPKTRIRREFTVSVASALPGTLRIAVRGVGQVAISHVSLTDGEQTLRRKDWSRARILGRRAPRRGWPDIDWTTNTGALVVDTKGS